MKRIDIYVSEAQFQTLATLSGTISEHIRRAIDNYLEDLRMKKTSSSLSPKKGEKENGQ